MFHIFIILNIFQYATSQSLTLEILERLDSRVGAITKEMGKNTKLSKKLIPRKYAYICKL
jgi:hypothetical protein